MHPTTLYHKTEPPRVVTDPVVHAQLLESGWADTPAAFYDDAHAAAPPAPTRRSKRHGEGSRT